jgi:uncharacterized membrane protein
MKNATRAALAVAAAVALLPSMAGAGKSAGAPPSGTATQVLPTSLGASSNCTGSSGSRINNGGVYPLQAVGQGSGCTNAQPRAVLWTASTGMVDLGTMAGAQGASAEGISDDGTVAGWLGGGVGLAFVRPFNGPMQLLGMMPGMIYASANDISANGDFIVGSNSTDSGGTAVRWDRTGADWSIRSIPQGSAVAVANNGAVAGSHSGRARIWTPTSTTYLPGVDTRANHISSDGTVVVGFRWQPCPQPCGQYEVPMLWILKDGNWTERELQALDGVDSEARGVAKVNGQWVIVGYGYTMKDAIMRAVVWRPDALGNYGAPIRLAALGGRSSAWARAEGINSKGQVVGTSAGSGLTRFAVMWQLP